MCIEFTCNNCRHKKTCKYGEDTNPSVCTDFRELKDYSVELCAEEMRYRIRFGGNK